MLQSWQAAAAEALMSFEDIWHDISGQLHDISGQLDKNGVQ